MIHALRIVKCVVVIQVVVFWWVSGEMGQNGEMWFFWCFEWVDDFVRMN